jgi:hypothetical protein
MVIRSDLMRPPVFVAQLLAEHRGATRVREAQSGELDSQASRIPLQRSSTFWVGPDVIGMPYWQAVSAREQRPVVRATPRDQASSQNSRSLARLRESAFVEIDEVRDALNVVAIGDSHLPFSLFEPRRD